MIRRKDDQAAQDTRTVARVRGALESYQAGGAQSVSVAHVLDLLNPRGLWSLDPQRRKNAPEQPQPAPDDRDPFTGCKPATAPGT